MSRKRKIEERTERALEQIRDARLSEEESEQIAARVWKRLEERGGAGAETAEIGTIRGCEDYQALIPALLSGTLAPSRALLLEDHTRGCVPCRRALKAARSGEPEERSAAPSAGHRRQPWRWAAAAVLALAAGVTGYLFWSSGPALPYGAVVESTGDGVYRAASLERIDRGSEVAVGERLRTAPGRNVVLRLADGSRVEVRGRSQLAVERARRGATLRVERGSVIVQAASQGEGHLYVSTDDCLVSVKGTIFAVSHGTKGSRVAVIEGEVQVDFAGGEQTLHAGQRTTTYGAPSPGGFAEELAWSDDLDSYLELLGEVTELRQALARELARPGLRYSSRLLELAPADMVFYAALPNLTGTLVEADRILRERIAGSRLLREWWEQRQGGEELDEHFRLVSSTLAEAGGFLGEEIVVTAGRGVDGGIAEPLILAELEDPQGLRAWLEGHMAEHPDELGGLVFLGEGTPEAGGDSLVVWLGERTLAASPRLDLVERVANRDGAAFGATAAGDPAGTLSDRLAEVYRGGAEILVAVDLQLLMEGEMAEGLGQARLAAGGLDGVRHLILEQKHAGEEARIEAVATFAGERRGMASWLAPPAPMGSLRYVSPDAKLVASAVLREPQEIFAEILASYEADGEIEPHERDDLELEAEIAAALGGELTVALDGPVVPEPAWKLIAEVYDPERLAWALGELLARFDAEAAASGGERHEWAEEQADGRTYYTLTGERSLVLAFDEGYAIVAPSRALVDRAIRYRRSGYTLESSPRFTRLLPADGGENFSALVYQDALALLGPLAERLEQGQLTPEQQQALAALREQNEPTLAYAYGEPERIVFAARGLQPLLDSGVAGLLGFGPSVLPGFHGSPGESH